MADDSVKISFQAEGNADQVIRSIRDGLKGVGEDAEKASKKTVNAFEVFKGSLAAQATVKGIELVTGALSYLWRNVVSDSIKSASVQEQAINKMNTALAITGKFSDETALSMQRFASQLQASSKFGDETVLAASALIQQLGNLDENGLKRATQAAADLSAALGIDLQSAAQLVGKAAAGEVGTLSRYGIAIERAGSKAETFARVLDTINAKFGGSARSEVNTFAGALAQLNNAVDDTKEEIGFLLINNESLINVINEVSKVFQGFSSAISENRDASNELVSRGIVLLIDALSLLVSFAETSAVVVTKLGAASYRTSAAISNVTNLLTLGMTDAGKRAKESMQIVQQFKDEAVRLEQGATGFTKLQDALAQFKMAAVSGYGESTASTERFKIANRSAAGAVEELTEAQKKLIEKGKQLAEQTLNKDPNRAYAENVKAIEAAAAKEIEIAQNKQLILDALEEERRQKESERYLKENEVALARFEENQRLIQDDLYTNEARVRANQNALAQIMADERLTTKDREKLTRTYNDTERQLSQQRLANQRDTLNTISLLTQANSKELQFIGKAAAISTATIDGWVAVQKALASAPPPFNFGLAAAVGVATAANVSRIVGTPLATGITEVPSGFPNDTFPARLTSGERVVDRGTNQDLKAFLAGSSQTNVLLTAMLNRLDKLENRVTVQIGQRTIVDEVRTALESGRLTGPFLSRVMV